MAILQGAVKMSTENQGPDAYDAVIADLRAQRDKIDQTIALLTALRGGGSAASIGVASGHGSASAQGQIVETAGMFLGMSIVDATKKLLAMRKSTMGNADIAAEIQAGGLVMTSKDPVNTVGSVLTRRFHEVGDVVKVGRGIWGLKEWYPGRNFKTNGKRSQTGAAPEEEAASDISEQPDFTNTFGAGSDDDII